MAKGFIDPPQEGESVQWSNNVGPGWQSTQATQSGQGGIAHPTSVTLDDDNTENGTISSASSQETLPPLSGSSMASPQESPQSSSVRINLPDSPVLSSTSSPTLSSQLAASSLTLPQLPGPSSPPVSLPALSHPQPPPSNQPSISVEELHQQAIQDSANNNVDENSNDQQYDRYAHYHQDYDQYTHDQSVRPRIRMRAGAGGEEDEPDHAPSAWPQEVGPRSRGEVDGPRHFHRRNLSEGLPSTSQGYRRDSAHGYPPLPTYNAYAGHEHSLPPDLYSSSSREPPIGQEWGGSPEGGQSPFPSSWPSLRSLRRGRYGLPTSPPEDTTQGARELLVNFTTEVLHNHHLQVPRDVMDQSGFSNPTWFKAGRELRTLADTFAQTEERRRVRCMAESVDMHSMNMHNFFDICAELFSDGITRERIVALFTFVGDVAVHQVRLRGEQFLQVLLNWSLSYFIRHVCSWVQEAGGWSVVLNRGANILYQTAVFAFCVFGSIAAGLFIYKTFKDW